MNERPALLTTRQVAAVLAVSPETVLRRIRAGELPAIRLASNAIRIREEDLDAFVLRLATAARASGFFGQMRREQQQQPDERK